MNSTVRTNLKKVLAHLIPDSPKLRYLAYLPRLATWKRGYDGSYPLFDNRYSLYNYVNIEILRQRPIDFLEFGVFKGKSLTYWATINTHSDSRFWGFDTFTGLPEPWINLTQRMEDGAFDLGGEIPKIEDTRVTLVEGLFQETLPNFLRQQVLRPQIVIHNDSDLYSSTLYVLTRCNDILVPGAVVIFDEFSSMLHEFRALEDYCSSYLRDYEVLAATRSPGNYYSQLAIRIL